MQLLFLYKHMHRTANGELLACYCTSHHEYTMDIHHSTSPNHPSHRAGRCACAQGYAGLTWYTVLELLELKQAVEQLKMLEGKMGSSFTAATAGGT